jgi:cyclophilin family peptidyl-prolyl cis-trans isomerase
LASDYTVTLAYRLGWYRSTGLAFFIGFILWGNPLVPVRAQSESDLRAEFNQRLAAWKETGKAAALARRQFALCDEDQAEYYRQEWIRAVGNGRDAFDSLIQAGVQRVQVEATSDPELLAFLTFVMEFQFDGGDYEAAYRLGQAITSVAADVAIVMQKQALCAFATNRFGECRELLARLAQAGIPLPSETAKLASSIDAQVAEWDRETKLREAEAAANDLPRVELIVEQAGSTQVVTLELFENEAPNTTANFVSLVERGFYDDRAFFKVVNHVDATCGCPNDDGSGGPGYWIASERSRPEARKHFRGSLAMVNMSAEGTQGSQFYVLLSPNPRLDGVDTVFGRVSEGLSNVDQLVRTHYPEESKQELTPFPGVVPARIKTARVLRKRDHEYVPQTITK